MSIKDDIFENISQYSPHQLLQHILDREVTVGEIMEECELEFDYEKRDKLESLLWDSVKGAGTPEMGHLYLENYPYGIHRQEALDMTDGTKLPELPPELPELHVIEEIEMPEIPSSDPWEAVDTTSIDSLNDFVDLNPDHPKVREARKLINSLHRETNVARGPEWLKNELAQATKNPLVIAQIVIGASESGQINTQELIEIFRQDHNFLPLESVRMLIDEGIISVSELERAGIKPQFISALLGTNMRLKETRVTTDFMTNPQRINKVCQEIYFWGMPSSGKTCALGAILSACETGGVAKTISKDSDCKGYDYMRQLSEVFEPDYISVLPTGTSASFVSDMSFDLYDDEDKVHSITMIDLAGEMLHAMYLVDQNRFNDLTPDQQTGYACMRNLLVDQQSKNSKIHFFVVEYGGHERREKGIRQVDMLNGAFTHIQKLGILKNTDAVFLLITKADKAYNEPGDVNLALENYVKTHYQSFYNNLKVNTKSINRGKVEIVPFTIGDVCFRDLCEYDNTMANEMVKLFLERTVGEKTGKAGKFNNAMRQ